MLEIITPERQAISWLEERGAGRVQLTRLGGHTNYVFLVERRYAPKSVLRLANHELSAELCPLAHHAARVCRIHQQVAELGLAPRLLATDIQDGIMWLEYVGEPHPVTQENSGGLRDMLQRLHASGLGADWSASGEVADGAGLGYLQPLINVSVGSDSVSGQQHQSLIAVAADYAGQLYQLGVERGYAECPLVPVHSDLNPGNCLYDVVAEKWSMIDWDFAGLRAAAWDYAGLCVEHGWTLEQSRAFVPAQISTADMIWFCALLALLSWTWHVQRASGVAVLKEKRAILIYWLSQLKSRG